MSMSAQTLREFIGNALPTLFPQGRKDAYMKQLVSGMEKNIILSGNLPDTLNCLGSSSTHFAILDQNGLRLTDRKPIGGNSQHVIYNAQECFEAPGAIALFVIARSQSNVTIKGYKMHSFADLNLARWEQWLLD